MVRMQQQNEMAREARAREAAVAKRAALINMQPRHPKCVGYVLTEIRELPGGHIATREMTAEETAAKVDEWHQSRVLASKHRLPTRPEFNEYRSWE